MSWALAEAERLIANLIRIGTIAELDDKKARVTVLIGDEVLTDWLPWLTQRAGEDRTWWAPEPGEQVLLLSPSGDLSQAVVLPAIYQDAYPPPADDVDIRREIYKDGMLVEYNRETHQYRMEIPAGGKLTLAVGSTTLVIEDGKITASANVIAEGIGLSTHKHPGTGGPIP